MKGGSPTLLSYFGNDEKYLEFNKDKIVRAIRLYDYDSIHTYLSNIYGVGEDSDYTKEQERLLLISELFENNCAPDECDKLLYYEDDSAYILHRDCAWRLDMSYYYEVDNALYYKELDIITFLSYTIVELGMFANYCITLLDVRTGLLYNCDLASFNESEKVTGRDLLSVKSRMLLQ